MAGRLPTGFLSPPFAIRGGVHYSRRAAARRLKNYRLGQSRPAWWASGSVRSRSILGKIGFSERIFEGIAVREVFRFVRAGFAENLTIDHIEYDVAEVARARDTPCSENGPGHRAKLLQGVFAYAFEQFDRRDMAIRTAARFIQHA